MTDRILSSRLLATLGFLTIVATFIGGAFATYWVSTLIGGDIVQSIAVLGYLLAALGVVFYLNLDA